MTQRFKLYRDTKHTITSLFIEQYNLEQQNGSNQSNAKQALMSIPDQQLIERSQNQQRRDKNGTEIARWNNYHWNFEDKQSRKIRKKLKKIRPRNASSQNCNIQNNYPHFSIGCSMKKELNKLYLPLKQKMINSQQFNLVQQEKQSNKTRNQVKMEIMSSKFELAPILQIKRKMNTQYNCQKIIKFRTENSHYQKIKRKGFFTVELQPEAIKQEIMIKNLSKTREKSFFLNTNLYDNNNKMKLKGNSIHQLFAR